MQESKEIMGDGRPVNLPGLYRQDDSGAEVITTSDNEFGRIQADALVQAGYKRVGDIPTKTFGAVATEVTEETAPSKKG